MSNQIPEEGPEFEAMMREIDAKFVKEGVAITARPLLAGREISIKYGVDFPMVDPGPRAPPELRRYGPLSTKVSAWFDAAYGDRLKIDMSPGRVVISVDGDFYLLRIPRFWGRGECLVSRLFFPKLPLELNRPFRLNIVELLDGMTQPKAQLISDQALQAAFDLFPVALRVMYDLESSSGNELIRRARSDLATAADKLMDRADHFGDSKWASLQAAEKCMKAAIEFEGSRYKPGHALRALNQDLSELGIRIRSPDLLDAIQCSPGIRYGDETCTREEALLAHQAAIQLVHQLIDAGSKFRSELTIRKLGIGTYEVVNTPRRRTSQL